jgi:hypothetical protein
MSSKKVVIVVLLTAAVSVTSYGAWISNKKSGEQKKAQILQTETTITAARTELEQLRLKSFERNELIRETLLAQSRDLASTEIANKLMFLEGVNLSDQGSLDAFDQIHSQVSNFVAENLRDQLLKTKGSPLNDGASFYRKLELLEKQYETHRRNYTEMALKANGRILAHKHVQKVLAPLPVFKSVEASLASTLETQD